MLNVPFSLSTFAISIDASYGFLKFILYENMPRIHLHAQLFALCVVVCAFYTLAYPNTSPVLSHISFSLSLAHTAL